MKKQFQNISIVLPCRNEVEEIKKCVQTILKQEEPENVIEVIVADGMSDDGTRDILQVMMSTVPKVRVLDNPGRIVSTGLNAALKAARGNIIIRMDAHTEYAPDYVRQCATAIQATDVDNVGGPWVARGSGYVSQTIAAAFQSPFAVGGARAHNPAYEGLVDTVYLGCWRKEAFERFGYFDEELVRNQDDEHNLRIIRGNGRIWQSPKIKSWYRPRDSLRTLFNQYLQYGYWKVRVIQKHKLPASPRHLVPGGFVLTLLLLLLTSVFCHVFSVPMGPWSVVRSLADAAFLLALAAYILCVLAASVATAAKTQWKLFWMLLLVFPCYHFGYGLGFLRGIVDFIVLRRGATTTFTRLTRNPITKNS